MKKILVTILLVFTLFALAACRESGSTSETGGSQYNGYVATDPPGEAPSEYYTQANETDISTALESLAGEWMGMGLSFQIYADGVWIGNSGDTRWRGKVEMTPESDGYIVEFIAIYIGGPGGMHDSDGNLREEALEIMETGEHDWWLPVYDGSFTLLIGTYTVHNDKFVSQDAAGNRQEMERWLE